VLQWLIWLILLLQRLIYVVIKIEKKLDS